MLCCVEYLFDPFGSAVLSVNPPNLLLVFSLLAVREGKSRVRIREGRVAVHGSAIAKILLCY